MNQLDIEDVHDDYGLRRAESAEPLLKEYSSPLTRSLSFPASRSFQFTLSPRLRRLIFLALAAVSAVSLIVAASVSVFRPQPRTVNSINPIAHLDTQSDPIEESFPPHDADLVHEPEPYHSPHLLGPPAQRFRDNLRNDTKYITSWISAGWTNDVMTYANLIYLGMITNRLPIVPMFTPSHIGGDAETILFGDVFDVHRFIHDSGIDIVEWRDVKDSASIEVDELGCWDIWEAVQYREHYPRRSAVPQLLQLDLSYTRAPDWVKLIPNYEHDQFSTFWSLARLSFPQERERSLVEPYPSPLHQVSLPPDEQLLCFDYLYYVCAQQPHEWEWDYSPAWRFVGQHLRWNQYIMSLWAVYVRRAFELPEDAEIPPYIAIHVRHGDFKVYCADPEDTEDCFAPIPAIARRVNEVREELLERKGINIPHTRVIMTSDESDQAWWDEVTSLGWVKMDHDAWQTAQTYGRWYPVIIDAAIQSNAHGFVGTDRSTYSTLSRRRVEDWQDGATRIVKWGWKDADAH